MLIEFSEINDHIIAKLKHDIMMTNVSEFTDEFKVILEKKPAFLSFDFGEVKFVDSSGIGTLINQVNQIKKNGTVISVFNMHKSLYSVFKLSGLYHIMELYKDADQFYQKFPQFKQSGNL